MIPRDKNAAVERALSEAFGVTVFEEIQLLSEESGTTLVFRILVQGVAYLMRILTRTDSVQDPARQFAFMQTAGEAGLSPRVRYANIADAICITDFVDALPFDATEALVRMPRALRTLHSLTPYPKALNYVTVDSTIRRFQASTLLLTAETDEIFARYAQLSVVYPRRDSDMVPCHDDLKPENIRFDGQRVWLVGWKAAFTNDRYFDLAVVANFLIGNEADEAVYLQEYFGQPPDEYQRARFFLMRQVMHMMYSAFMLLLGSAGKPVNVSEKLPSFKAFHERVWAGEINPVDGDLKVVYGRLHWEQLLENMRQPRFDESLRIVAERDACPGGMPRLLPVT